MSYNENTKLSQILSEHPWLEEELPKRYPELKAMDNPAARFMLKRMNGRRGGEAKAKLYLDTGAGFREEETIEVDHRPDGSIYIE